MKPFKNKAEARKHFGLSKINKCEYHKRRNATYECACGCYFCSECISENGGDCPEDREDHYISKI